MLFYVTCYDIEEEDNSFGVVRYPCMPSLVALQQMRNRYHLANLGRKLMKWSALAAGTELRHVAATLEQVYQSFSEDMRDAYIVLARCRYFYPNLNKMVLEGIPNVAEIVLKTSTKTASGVKIIQYQIIENNTHPYEHLGIDKGGQLILDAKKTWLELLKRIILMVELRTNFVLIENVRNAANKKWNVLSKLVIPRISLSVHYIKSELEEIEREDNFRLKRFKALKIKKKGQGLVNSRHIKESTIIELDEGQSEEFKEVDDGMEETKSLDASMKGEKSSKIKPLSDIEEKKSSIRREKSTQNKYKKEETDKTSFYLPSEGHLRSKIIEESSKGTSQKCLQDIILHTDEIIRISATSDATSDNKILGSHEELKAILEKLLVDRVSDYFKRKISFTNNEEAPLDNKLAKPSKLSSDISVPESMFSIKPENEKKLGQYERKYTEIIKVLRLQNEDGTISQVKKKITVKTDKQNPIKAETTDKETNQHLKCLCFDSDSDSDESLEQCKCEKNKIDCCYVDKEKQIEKEKRSYPSNTKSEPVCRSSQWNETKPRQCISAVGVKELKKINTVTCSCSGSITVNLTFQGGTCEKVQNINISQLPLPSSVNINFCNVPNNLIQQPCNLYNESCTASNPMLPNDVHERTSQFLMTASNKNMCTCNSLHQKTFNDALTKNASNGFVDVSYVFDNTKQKHMGIEKFNSNSSKLPKFAYVFNKVEKLGSHLSNASDLDTLFKECCSHSCDFSYIFSSYKRIEIERMIIYACSHVVNFPYIFSQCASSESVKERMELDAKTCCCPSESTLDLSFQDEICKCPNIKESQTSINVNFFTVPGNMFHKSSLGSNVFKNFKDENNDTLPGIQPKTSSQNVVSSTNENKCMCYFVQSERGVDEGSQTLTSMTDETTTDSDKNDATFLFNNEFENKIDGDHRGDDLQQFTKVTDTLLSECNNTTTLFPYILSTSQRNEIDSMIKNACSFTPNYPYLYSNLNRETQADMVHDLKPIDINSMFNDACKRSDNFSYIFSRIKSNQINDLIESACTKKFVFPYMFSKVIKKENSKKHNVQSQKAEIEAMFKSASKRLFEFSYIFNHLNSVKIDNMIKEACKHVHEFPYVFERVESRCKAKVPLKADLSSSSHVCEGYCPRSHHFNNLFCPLNYYEIYCYPSKEEIKSDCSKIFKKIKCQRATCNSNNFSYIFAKTSELSWYKLPNDYDKKIKITDTDCAKEQGFTRELNYIENLDTMQDNNSVEEDISKSFQRNAHNNECNALYKHSNEQGKNIEVDKSFYIFDEVINSSGSELNNSKNVSIFENECNCHQEEKLSKHIEQPSNNHTQKEAKGENLKKKEQSLGNNVRTVDVYKYAPNVRYIFSKVLQSCYCTNHLNSLNTNDAVKDICSRGHDFPYMFNRLGHANFRPCCDEAHYLRLKEIDKLFQDSCKKRSKAKCIFKYIFDKVDLKKSQHDFRYIFSKVKKPSEVDFYIFENEKTPTPYEWQDNNSNLNEIKSHSFQNLNNKNNVQKFKAMDSKNNSSYIFSKVLAKNESINPPNYEEIDAMFKDACRRKNDFPYIFNAVVPNHQKIDQLFKDSCKTDFNLKRKYAYLFQKVPKLPCVKCKNIDCKCQKRLTRRKSQIINPLNANNASHRLLIRLPSSKGRSSCHGIEIMWKTGCICNKGIGSNHSKTTKYLPSSRSFNVNIDNKDERATCSCITKSKSLPLNNNILQRPINEVEKEKLLSSQNTSFMRRMLNSVKNVYVPFSKSVTSGETKTNSPKKFDNLNSLLSNSTTSTYSWKSCVMKTCQAEIEHVEKNISYSGFSLGSIGSLDYVSYKSEAAGSDDKSLCCKHMNANSVGEKRILFDFETSQGSSAYYADSSKKANSFKPFCKSQSDYSIKCTYLSHNRSQLSLRLFFGNQSGLLDDEQNANKPKSQCTSDYRDRSHFRCAFSSSSILEYHQTSLSSSRDCCCDYYKHGNNFENTECTRPAKACISKTNVKILKKSKSVDKNTCSCSKKS